MVPAVAWAASFVVCGIGDALLGRWVLLPLFVAAFYGGMVVIDLLTYPMLSFWRGWLRRRGLLAWYLVEVAGLWGGATVVLFLLSPWWLGWSWDGTLPLQIFGGLLLVGSVAVGTWAVAKMGWARLLFAGALFLMLLAALYLAQLGLQLPLEERELRERFGAPYRRYCDLVPRFVPRLRPVRRRDLGT